MKRFQVELIPAPHSMIAERNKKAVYRSIALSGAQIVGGDRHIIIEVGQTAANDLQASISGKAHVRETA